MFGGERHLKLAEIDDRGKPWPVPFDARGVLAARGRPTVVLASGDPFWHGVGASLAAHLATSEWTAHPSPSTFSLVAARLGWRLESTICLGLHAAPFERLVPVLSHGVRVICLLRDGKAAADLAQWLTAHGWGASRLWTLMALGGPRESIREARAQSYAGDERADLLAVAIEAEGTGGLSRASGLADDLFAHDGQITKQPMRALALSALAPRPDERLWDIGAGSGSISVEWALAGGTAVAIETRGTAQPISARTPLRSASRIESRSSMVRRLRRSRAWRNLTRSSLVVGWMRRCSMGSGRSCQKARASLPIR